MSDDFKHNINKIMIIKIKECTFCELNENFHTQSKSQLLSFFVCFLFVFFYGESLYSVFSLVLYHFV